MPQAGIHRQPPLITPRDGRAYPGLRHRGETNVGPWERVASGTIGGTLIGYGLTHRNPVGVGALIVGGVLAFHGAKRHSPLYGALGITGEDAQANPLERSVHSRATTTIDAAAQELYDAWKDVQVLRRFFPHVSDVRAQGDGRSQWTVTLPGDRKVHWLAEIVEDKPGEKIAWSTDQDAPFDHQGSITFARAAGGRGTRVTLELRYHLPGGVLGVLLAKAMLADPQMEAPQALGRLKQWVEAGEISVNTSPSARGVTRGSLRRAKNPAESGRPDRPSTDRAGPDRAGPDRDGPDPDGPDPVDEASRDSFPASDPPAFTGTSASPGTSDRPDRPWQGQ